MSDVNYPAYPASGPPAGDGKAPLVKGRTGGTTKPVPVQYVSGQVVRLGQDGAPDRYVQYTGWLGCKETSPKSHLHTRISDGGKGRPAKGTPFCDCGREKGVQGSNNFFDVAKEHVSSQLARSSRDVAPFAKPVLQVVGAVIGGGAGVAVGGAVGSIAETGLAGKDPKKARERDAKLYADALAKALSGKLGPEAKKEAQAQQRIDKAYQAASDAANALEVELARKPINAAKLARAQAEADRTAANAAAVKAEVCAVYKCQGANPDVNAREGVVAGAGGPVERPTEIPGSGRKLWIALAIAAAVVVVVYLVRK